MKTFRHGVHPPEHKTETCALPIRRFPFAPVMLVPLQQHIGKPAVPVVRESEEVRRGQMIAEPDGFMSVAMHAPASGTIRRIGQVLSANGKMVPGIYLEPFPASTQQVDPGEPCDLETATPEEIVRAVQLAGIVGLGGAAFPTHVKLRIPDGKSVDTLVINGVECEPYLTTDHRVMLEQPDDIFQGIRYLLKATGATEAVIGIEANKADAAVALAAAVPPDVPVSVEQVEVKYPQGAEKMLITALLGREVPSGGLPLDVNVLTVNVATVAEIGRLLPVGRGIQERVITVSGAGVTDPGNYLVPIGTPLRFLLEQAGISPSATSVVLGGPMMGQAVASVDIPITKGTSGVVVLADKNGEAMPREYPCIKCGWCLDACPLYLNPSRLGILAKSGQHERMAADFHLFDCFECGSCAWVCPSHIPLVQYFRTAKGILRDRERAA